MQVKSRPFKVDPNDLYEAQRVLLRPLERFQRVRLLFSAVLFFAGAVVFGLGPGIDGLLFQWQVLVTGIALGFALLVAVLLVSSAGNPLLRKQINERGHLKYLQNELTVVIEDGKMTTSRAGLTSTMPLEGFHKFEVKDGGTALYNPGSRALVILRKEYFTDEGSWEGVQSYLENVPRLL
jgi:hypothetical protein